MSAINLQNVNKSYAGADVLRDVSLTLHKNERIGLVGANGSGKTTLFRLILGITPPDTGTVTTTKGISLSYLPQEPNIDENLSLIEAATEPFAEHRALELELRKLTEEIAEAHGGPGADDLLTKYDRLHAQFEAGGGYGYEIRIREVLGGLGFSPEDYQLPVRVLSGGQKCRASLARMLMSGADYLLLDEPTNHLDIDATRWLEKYLVGYSGGVIVISHDRFLLDRVVTKIVEVERCSVSVYPTNYTNYAEAKRIRQLNAVREYEKQSEWIAHQKDYIERTRYRKDTAKQSRSRQKLLANMKERGKILDEPTQNKRKINLKFDPNKKSGDMVVRVEGACKSFDDIQLFKDFNFEMTAGEKVGIIGPNGVGKTTLLRMLLKQIPADAGLVRLFENLSVGYYDQEHRDLNPDHSVIEAVREVRPEIKEPEARSYLALFLFQGDAVFKRVGNLSGGEQSRVLLARLVWTNPQVLVLDEPTNHLDITAIEWLESNLRQSDSALVMISHDRRFLENLSYLTVWMDRGQSRALNKGFSGFEEWRDKILEQEEVQRHKLDRKIVREEHWITHGVSGRRKRNMRRVGELSDLRENKASQRKVEGGINLTLAEGEGSGKLVARLFSVSKSYGDREIIRDLSTTIQRGDRIGIVGPNGAGKTTLVNLITGKLAPDSGKVKLGIAAEVLVVDQNREMLDPDWTLKDALTDGKGDMVAIGEENKHVISYMRDFLFLPEQVGTPLRTLSGGERARLMLARGLRTPSNFLVLDEPTNDLDLETLDLLQEFVANYPGTVLIVSHDRDFLDRTCTSVLAPAGNGIWHEYAGGYSDMQAQRGNIVSKSSTKPQKSQSNKKPASEKKSASNKLSFTQKHSLETLPDEIERLEFEIGKLKQALAEPDLYARDPKKFDTWVDALADREKNLVDKEEEWLNLEMVREEIENQR